ncbi:MAG: hypothetical protein JO102_02085 [Elusimicrobia bacterium]|nr:hypothetical protein [Elusimicrobiota bacterium]
MIPAESAPVTAVSWRRSFPLKMVIAVGVFIALAGLYLGRYEWLSSEPRDYFQFWAVGDAVKRFDVSDIYSVRERNRVGSRYIRETSRVELGNSYKDAALARAQLEPTGTPFLYTLFTLVSTGNFDVDYAHFRSFSAFSYFLGMYCLLIFAGVYPLVAAAGLLIASNWFDPLRLDISFSNLNQIQIGMICALILLGRQKMTSRLSFLEGMFIAVVVFFKPTLVYAVGFVGLWEVLEGKWMRLRVQLAGFVAGAAVAMGSSIAMFGETVSWRRWFPSFQSIVFEPRYTVQSFITMVFHTDNMMVFQTASVIGALVIAALLYRDAGRSPEMSVVVGPYGELEPVDFAYRWLVSGMGIGLYIMTSPLVHGHYFLQMVPLAFYFFRPGVLGETRPRFKSPVFWTSVVCILILGSHPFLSDIGFDQGPYHNLATFFATFALMIMAAAEIRHLRSIWSPVLAV